MVAYSYTVAVYGQLMVAHGQLMAYSQLMAQRCVRGGSGGY